MKNRFEYFLNAVHYCIWIREMKISFFLKKLFNKILNPFIYPFVSEKRKRFHSIQMVKFDRFIKDERAGMDIGLAHHIFGSVYSMYPAFITFVSFGIYFRYFTDDGLNKVIMFALSIIPIGLLYIPAYKAVFYKDRYLKYFKKFKKKDRKWHKKWNWITTLFMIMALVSAFLGILCAFIILGMI